MPNPTIQPGQVGDQYAYVSTHVQDFDGTKPLSETFSFNRMEDGLHRVGNEGQDEFGNPKEGSARGLRWSARYLNPEWTCFIENRALVFGARLSNELNPTRKAFTHKGETFRPDLVRIDGQFAVTWDRKWDNDKGHHVTDPDSPNITIGPNTFVEFECDARQMKTPGARWSAYLLGAYENDSGAYDEDGTLATENDWPEIEAGGPEDGLDHDKRLQNKILSGLAGGSTPGGNVDVSQVIPGFSFREGVHKYAILRLKNLIVWYVDGIEVIRETDPRRITLTAMYIVFSREFNTGAKNAADASGDDLVADPPKLPRDPGIFITNVYKYADRLNTDRCLINYLHIYEVQGDLPEAGRGIGDGVSGIRPQFTSGAPSNSSHTFSWSIAGRNIGQWRLKVGSERGRGNYFESGTTSNTSAVVSGLPTDGSSINVRLWFREDDDDVWDFQDIGYPELSDYWRGTEGRIRVTTVEDIARTPPTAGGAPYLGAKGTAPPIVDGGTTPGGGSQGDGSSDGSASAKAVPRLVIMTSPQIRDGYPENHIVAVPTDGYDPTGKTFTWASSIPGLTFEPQGQLTTRPSIDGLTEDQLGTITIDDGVDESAVLPNINIAITNVQGAYEAAI